MPIFAYATQKGGVQQWLAVVLPRRKAVAERRNSAF